MKALSLFIEHAADIVDGVKKEEYRNWNTAHRGDTLICASATMGTHGFAACVVEIVDVKKTKDGNYAFVLENVRKIRPTPIKGKQRLFEIDFEPEFLNLSGKEYTAICREFFESDKFIKKPKKRGEKNEPSNEGSESKRELCTA